MFHVTVLSKKRSPLTGLIISNSLLFIKGRDKTSLGLDKEIG